MSYLTRDPAFMLRLGRICARIGIPDCRMLLAVFEFESGSNPQCVNGIGATGLIQFMPATARSLGTTTADLLQMSGLEQLEYVEKYLMPFRGKLHTLSDLYMAVLWPAAVGKPEDYVLWIKGEPAYRVNPMDWNADGSITKAEASRRVSEIYARICAEMLGMAMMPIGPGRNGDYYGLG